VVAFTGADRHDDQVDALAAVYDSMHVAGQVDWNFLESLRDVAPAPFQGFIAAPFTGAYN